MHPHDDWSRRRQRPTRPRVAPALFDAGAGKPAVATGMGREIVGGVYHGTTALALAGSRATRCLATPGPVMIRAASTRVDAPVMDQREASHRARRYGLGLYARKP